MLRVWFGDRDNVIYKKNIIIIGEAWSTITEDNTSA